MFTVIIKDKNSDALPGAGKKILGVRHPKKMPASLVFKGKRYPVTQYTSVDAIVYVGE